MARQCLPGWAQGDGVVVHLCIVPWQLLNGCGDDAHQKQSAHTAQEGGCFLPCRPAQLCDQGMAMLFVLDLVAREPWSEPWKGEAEVRKMIAKQSHPIPAPSALSS